MSLLYQFRLQGLKVCLGPVDATSIIDDFACIPMQSVGKRVIQFLRLHELNELWEILIYLAQCKTRGIWNGDGFGTRPYMIYATVYSINQSSPYSL